MALPSFFIIGAAKAGTTSLHAYLSGHPEIHMSAVKEPDYFAPVDRSDLFKDRARACGRAEYEALFEAEALIRGESSGAYSQHPRRPGVPERIHEAIPDARFVYLVRDPIERIRAFYVQRASMGAYGTLEEAIGNVHDPANDYVCPSRYFAQVERYLALFPSERMLVVDSDDLLNRRRAVLRRILEFLGADPEYWSEDYDGIRNASADKRRYSPTYARVARLEPVRRALRALPPRVREEVGTGARRAFRRPLRSPRIEAGLRDRLEEILAPEAERLRAFSGQEFPSWSV